MNSSALDIDTSQIGLRRDSPKGNPDEYDDEYVEKEGGDKEEVSEESAQKQDYGDESPNPLRGRTRVPQMQARPVSSEGKKRDNPVKKQKNTINDRT